MSWTLTYSTQAKKDQRRLEHHKSLKARILWALEEIAENPYRGKPLHGPIKNRLSWRTGDFRIIYEIHGDTLTILVIAIGHRREVYQRIHEALDVRYDTSAPNPPAG